MGKPTHKSIFVQTRVVGGVVATKNDFPWLVSLNKPLYGRYVHYCGGAIIHDYYILTAAHCSDNFIGRENELMVRVGAYDLSDDGDGYVVRVAKIIVHERWDRENNLNDIALYKTDVPIKYMINERTGRYQINSICLPRADHEMPDEALIAGWGQTSKDSYTSQVIQKLVVPLYPTDQCRLNYQNIGDITQNMVCFGGQGGRDSCMGDSGGPLIEAVGNRAYIIGIVSYGVACAESSFPTVYTKVSRYVDWIHQKIQS
ncbi:unnamed protein product [Oppiella nova]|uniref:Peptidase S1 domain-containing protein n=1 Tax=Oppiella nova TaxID=334625 RepID=A0A7R9M583_9ACAR|nr:unnamed protein product [Oppiella nova]CAG2170896.1 unnamed protein product [Oppiella nova]